MISGKDTAVEFFKCTFRQFEHHKTSYIYCSCIVLDKHPYCQYLQNSATHTKTDWYVALHGKSKICYLDFGVICSCNCFISVSVPGASKDITHTKTKVSITTWPMSYSHVYHRTMISYWNNNLWRYDTKAPRWASKPKVKQCVRQMNWSRPRLWLTPNVGLLGETEPVSHNPIFLPASFLLKTRKSMHFQNQRFNIWDQFSPL